MPNKIPLRSKILISDGGHGVVTGDHRHFDRQRRHSHHDGQPRRHVRAEISWVVTGYIIANAIVLPIASWMSEQLGRKFYYTSCIALFTAASVACGLAPNLATLIVFRIIQGFAGGALLPTSQALIYEAFPKEQAGMASAIYGMSVMIGPTIGPTLGDI